MVAAVPAPNPAAFDALAATYDDSFTRSALGRLLRDRVQAVLAAEFSAGQRVLELACGTGEDAVWLSARGVRVLATDGSPQMLRVAKSKLTHAGTAGQESAVALLSLQHIAGGALAGSVFDGAFSNFGGLNTLACRAELAVGLAKLLNPGGRLVLVVMGPVCPWEIAAFALRGWPKTAFRRWGGPAVAVLGGQKIPVWYPLPRRLRAEFAPYFRHMRTESLGLFLPTSETVGRLARRPGWLRRLNQLEQKFARRTAGWGDHYISVFEKI